MCIVLYYRWKIENWNLKYVTLCCKNIMRTEMHIEWGKKNNNNNNMWLIYIGLALYDIQAIINFLPFSNRYKISLHRYIKATILIFPFPSITNELLTIEWIENNETTNKYINECLNGVFDWRVISTFWSSVSWCF